MIERIVALAEEQGMKMSFLEKQLGVYRGKVADWKLRRSSPNVTEIRKIAEILGTTEAYLRGETDDPTPDDLDIDTSDLSWAVYKDSRELSDDDKRELLAIIQIKKNKKK